MAYTLNDEVWHRVAQIVQEAMLTGQDCATLLREIQVTEGESDLVLTKDYKVAVKERHAALLSQAEKIQSVSKNEGA